MDDQLAQRLNSVASALKLEGKPNPQAVSAGSKRRRRGYDPGDYTGLAKLRLIRDRDVLRWSYLSPVRRRIKREGLRRHLPIGAKPVFELSIEDTPPNQLVEKLQNLDSSLTPHEGLRRYDPGTSTLQAVPDGTLSDGSILLLVH